VEKRPDYTVYNDIKNEKNPLQIFLLL